MTPLARTLWLACALGSCGYQVGLDDFGAGIRDVAVEIVDNRTFRQNFEVPLTREIYRELAIHTDLRPTKFETADAILRVVILEITNQGLVRDLTPVREGSLDFTVEVSLVDRRNGEVLRKREILDRAEFRSPVGENEESARFEAVSDLARKIVLALEGDF